ncbi:MAG: SGNH/GDSL hydrolase family protein [Fimbriimonadaceae bacterium]|nr:SGNH/GDSL hydrolase family protein [Fimbriimonadaceae bacterium]
MRVLTPLSLAVALAISALSQAQFTSFVSFGDSLSDSGNINNLTFGISPGAGYFNGRFSNGPVWNERVAASFGLTAVASTSGGTNYAYGGSLSGAGFTNFIVPNMTPQVNSYLASNTPTASVLFTVWSGGNDYLNGSTNVGQVVSNISNNITSLYNAGGRHFIVPNLPLLGNIPRNIGTVNQGPANVLSAAHNSALSNQISVLRTNLSGIKIYTVDIAGIFEEVRLNPGAFGLTNVSDPALVNGVVVPNEDQYLFFDSIHPTRIGHQLVADAAIRAVPEPMTLTALTLGALALAKRRRSRKSA